MERAIKVQNFANILLMGVTSTVAVFGAIDGLGATGYDFFGELSPTTTQYVGGVAGGLVGLVVGGAFGFNFSQGVFMLLSPGSFTPSRIEEYRKQ